MPRRLPRVIKAIAETPSGTRKSWRSGMAEVTAAIPAVANGLTRAMPFIAGTIRSMRPRGRLLISVAEIYPGATDLKLSWRGTTRRYGVRAVEPYRTSRSSIPSGDFVGAARSCRGMTMRSEWCPSSRCDLASTRGRDLRSSSESEGGSRDFPARRGIRTNERGRLPSVISPPSRCYSGAKRKLKLVVNGSIFSRPWFGYLCAIAFTVVVTGAVALIRVVADVGNASMLYLLAVMASAVLFGRGPAIFASVASFLAFNFFFLEPHYTLDVTSDDEILSLMLLLVARVVTGGLTALLRPRALPAVARDREAAAGAP